MSKNNAALVLIALAFAQVVPASAQNYNYSYGGSRVVNQNQTGLYTPSSTYIGCGTLSRSAQGKSAGVGGSLPQCNMGSHVRTAGDNLYNNDGTDRQNNGALIYQDQEAAIARASYTRYARQQARLRQQAMQQQQQQQLGTVYVPGSNGATPTYGNNAAYRPVYGGSSTSGAPSQSRQF